MSEMTNRERAEAVRRAGEHLISDANRCKSYKAEGTLRDDGVTCCKVADLLERTPDMRPMTPEEAVKYGKPMWKEWYSYSFACCEALAPEWVLPDSVEHFNQICTGNNDVRFWPDKPTPEQSAQWPWEEE